MTKPLISAIMIFLNGEKYMVEAIESIIAQTYDNWELLLVDDGSTDKSTEISQRYAAKYPEKVRYLEHENHQNRGMSASRNLGIKNARGEYIAFLDADDVWLPPKLEKQLAILNAQPTAGMVYGPTLMWYAWTGRAEDKKLDRLRGLGVQPNTLVQPPNLLTLFLQRVAETPGTCGVLIRREVVDAVGGFEEEFRGMYEDQIFFAKVCLKVPVFVQRETWDLYRQHLDSNCYVAIKAGKYLVGEMNPSYANYLKWLQEYLLKQGMENTTVWQVLQKQLWPVRHPILYRMLRPVRRFYQLMERLQAKIKNIAQMFSSHPPKDISTLIKF